jgi:broad specificity phosphatase PhoE
MSDCPVVVFLARHADVAAGGGTDPVLSDAGAARAKVLRRMLADTGIGAIFTTSLKRSRQTAAPLASELGLVPRVLDDVNDVVAALHDLPSATTALVIGHSNTLPVIIAGLGGPAIPNIGEAEFDNLFVQAGPCLSRLRYGA